MIIFLNKFLLKNLPLRWRSFAGKKNAINGTPKIEKRFVRPTNNQVKIIY